MGRHGGAAGPRVEPLPSTSATPTGRHRHAAPNAVLTPEPPVVTSPAPVAAPAPAGVAPGALRETVAWSAFAVGVLWVVIVASGRGVVSATAWAGSLLGLVLAAVALLALTSRPHRTHPGSHAREG
jgi:hypothetical protein